MTRRRSLRAVATAYLVAIAVAIALAWLVASRTGWGPLATAFFADIVATFVIFAFSIRYNNSSVYDAYWSVIPPLLGGYWLFELMGPDIPALRPALMVALTTVWGVRLTYNWAVGWPGMHHEDWRYVRQRELTGRAYWLVSGAGLHLFPTLLVFLGCVPIWVAADRGVPMGPLDVVAFLVTAAAIAIETVADAQLRAFRDANPPPGAIMDRGLWAWSRHPNYFGELLFWCGIGLFGLAAVPGECWPMAGGLAMAALFFFISIPMIDKRHLERRPQYAEHRRRVSRLIPLPPRKA